MPKTKTTTQFINDAKTIHGDLYDYSAVCYTFGITPVTIICNEHGRFDQRPTDHLNNKAGCPKCANTQKGLYHKSNTSKFITEAKSIHGDKYDYSLVDYKNIHTKVTIICPEHGPFDQTPASHTKSKCGCNPCSFKDYQGGYGHTRFTNHPEIKDQPAILYIIETGGDERFIKIGVTQKELKVRMNRARLPWPYETLKTWTGTTYELFIIEQSVKQIFKPNKYKPNSKFNGHTECFNKSVTSNVIATIGMLKNES